MNIMIDKYGVLICWVVVLIGIAICDAEIIRNYYVVKP
jgi:hypothetical protein